MKQAIFGRKYQYHQSRQLLVSYRPNVSATKTMTSLTISFTFLLKKCGRDCQVNTIRLFFLHLIFWHCIHLCTLRFRNFSSDVSWTGQMTIADFCRRITQLSSLYWKNGMSGGEQYDCYPRSSFLSSYKQFVCCFF